MDDQAPNASGIFSHPRSGPSHVHEHDVGPGMGRPVDSCADQWWTYRDRDLSRACSCVGVAERLLEPARAAAESGAGTPPGPECRPADQAGAESDGSGPIVAAALDEIRASDPS